MEFPSFNHHNHTRYVPPPPNNFSDDHSNFYHHLPPLSYPNVSPLSYPNLPPPPLPVPPPPPPPSYQSHLTFLDPQNLSFPNHNRSSSPPRFSNRFDYRFDSRSDPHNHRRFYPQSDSSYYKPERLIPSSTSISRFKDDNNNIIDGYATTDVMHINDRYASSGSVMNMDKSTGYSSRNLEPYYVPKSENERIWDRHGDEDPKWVMKNELRDYDYKSNKVNNRVREGREEFKQVQKKSVLLRIGKLNNTSRNRNNDQHFSKPHLLESNSTTFRAKDKDRDHTGKDSSLYVDQNTEERDRESSPVELDVSFKSNALVAKAVVTPSSPFSDNNYSQPRNRKAKRVSDFDSPLSKFTEPSPRSGSSSHGLDTPSSSEKPPKQSRDKDAVNGSLSGPVLDHCGGSGGSNGPLTFRLRKKRKLRNLGSKAFNFQVDGKDHKSVKGEENIKNTPIAPIPFPSLEEIISIEVDKSSHSVIPEKDGSEVENGDFSTENKNLDAYKLSVINDSLGIDLNQQPNENEISLNIVNDTQMVSKDVKLSLGGTDISTTPGQDQIEIHKFPTESHASFDASNILHSFCNGFVKMPDTNSLDSCSGEIIIVSPEKSDVQGFFDDVPRKEDESQLLEGTSKFPEDVLKESQNAVIVAEDDEILGSGEIYVFGENHEKVIDVRATPSCSFKESCSDKDEVTRMVNSTSTSVQTISPDHGESGTDETYLLPKDDVPLLSFISACDNDTVAFVTDSNDKSGESVPDHGESGTDETYLLPKDDVPLLSFISACDNDTVAFVTDSNDKSGESVPDMLTGIVSSQKVSSFSDSQVLTSELTDKTISNLSIPMNDENICEKSVSKDGALVNGPELFLENSRTCNKTSLLEVTKTVRSVTTLASTTKLQESNLSMTKLGSVSAVPRVFTGRSTPVFTNSRVNNPSKPRTWHRSTSNPPPPKQMGQNSYIRSGNTLVRKSASLTAVTSVPPTSRSSAYQLNPSGLIEIQNTAVNSTFSRTGRPGAPVVRPNTPPLSGSTKLPDCPTYSRDLPSSPLEHLPEDQNGTSSNFESQKTLNEGGSGKKIHYMKMKSNQLVAASTTDQPIQDILSSDGYYKRRKNQLIRTSAGDDSVNTDVPKVSKINIKRQSGKGISKKYKHLRFPSVWTLGSQSSGKDGVSLHQKLRPHLFPWKRSRNWGNVTSISASIPSNSSSLLISRKLLLSRKREMIYTRSKHGFSLRMSKLLSVGGSSLKWSKSLEKNSKRANVEATLAVAAAEQKKREQHGSSETNRDRIFRIGLVRYKMDPSRRTLQRISDEEPSTSMQSKEEMRKSYVPKRLKIGHDEYVRIGNGNQLVRNPKRRTRIFASEKVRWSLHTARLRLAKKKKYCQFFTRFGKCNKDDGKCPYIHDSSKIAVCTKFLCGSCSNLNCKLTHKVIPERMQVCFYFLQGLCSNKDCPYRHVNVNSAASICEGFLKGFCADGNECRKKHTYACPVFEATGACSHGTKCKLQHPRNRNLGLKRKQHSVEHQKNGGGRYFGSIIGAEAMQISEKHHVKDDDEDILCQEGKFAEFIGLGFSNEEAGETMSDQRTMLVSESSGLGAAEFDDLTKPIGIMKTTVFDIPRV